MSKRPDSANDEMPHKASEWLVALAEQPDSTELRRAFDRWVASSPDNARDWAEINRASTLLAATTLSRKPDWASFLEQHRTAHANRSRHRRRFWSGGVAAMVTAACIALFMMGNDLLIRIEADYLTATAEQRSVRLPDGTNVVLGPESAISASYSDSVRHIQVLKGGAFFEVADLDRRPFAVFARDVEARDIGTAFEVRLGAKTVDVAVREGIVDVSSASTGAPVRLIAGQWARVGSRDVVDRGQTNPELIAPWTQGQLVVNRRPVAEVVDALRPYFGGIIVVRGSRFAAEPLTGVYHLSDPVEALGAVARAQGATLWQISPWVIVISGD